MSEPCTPRVGVSHAYPHELELSCWEHGFIANLGCTATAADIARFTAEHLKDWMEIEAVKP